MKIRERLTDLKIDLPEPPNPVGIYVPIIRSGSTLFVSGQLPIRNADVVFKGKVGRDISIEEAKSAAELCALNAISILNTVTENVNSLRILRLCGYVQCDPEFKEHATIVNGASELFGSVFGDSGIHARLVIGVVSLPLDATVELEIIAETSDF